MERELPIPMDVERLVTNTPDLGMFLLESFRQNGEELLAPRRDDLWLHRPQTGIAAPSARHAAPARHIALRVRSTGHFSYQRSGLPGGATFTLVVHIVGRPWRPR